jgi:hypothetical protein
MAWPSGQFIEAVYILMQVEKPQDFGKCVTYARRYSMSALLGVEADDDDDARDIGDATKKAPPSPPRRAAPAPPRPAAAPRPAHVPAADINLGGEVPGHDIIPPASEEPPHPADTAEPGEGDGPDVPGAEGLIEKVLTQDSKAGAARAWKRFDVWMDGHRYSTFDKKIGGLAQDCCAGKRRVRIVFNQTDKGLDILELVAL